MARDRAEVGRDLRAKAQDYEIRVLELRARAARLWQLSGPKDPHNRRVEADRMQKTADSLDELLGLLVEAADLLGDD